MHTTSKVKVVCVRERWEANSEFFGVGSSQRVNPCQPRQEDMLGKRLAFQYHNRERSVLHHLAGRCLPHCIQNSGLQPHWSLVTYYSNSPQKLVEDKKILTHDCVHPQLLEHANGKCSPVHGMALVIALLLSAVRISKCGWHSLSTANHQHCGDLLSEEAKYQLASMPGNCGYQFCTLPQSTGLTCWSREMRNRRIVEFCPES